MNTEISKTRGVGQSNNKFENLQLVYDLCVLYERRLCDLNENAPEMIRIIRAVCDGQKILLHPESLTAYVLRDSMPNNKDLWDVVSISEPEVSH